MKWFDAGATAMPDDTSEALALKARVRRGRGLSAGYAAGCGALRGALGGLLCLVIWAIEAALLERKGSEPVSGLDLAVFLLIFGLSTACVLGAVLGAILGLVLLPSSRALPPPSAGLVGAVVSGGVVLLIFGLLASPDSWTLGTWGVAAACASIAGAWHAWRMSTRHQRWVAP